MLDEVDSLLLGRKPYDLMESFWPGEQGQAHSPQIADRMHHHQELVASHHEFEDAWSPTRRLRGDLVESVADLKSRPGKDIAVLGGESLLVQLTRPVSPTSCGSR